MDWITLTIEIEDSRIRDMGLKPNVDTVPLILQPWEITAMYPTRTDDDEHMRTVIYASGTDFTVLETPEEIMAMIEHIEAEEMAENLQLAEELRHRINDSIEE